MASNPGEILISGFNTGLGIRRNIEETAKLVRERETAEQADQLWKETSITVQPIRDQIAFKQAHLQQLMLKRDAKYTVDPKEIDLVTKEVGNLTTDMLAAMQIQAVQLMQSGNPMAMERAQSVLTNLVQMKASIAAQQEAVFQRNADDERLDKKLANDAQIAADQNAARLKGTEMEQVGAGERAKLAAKTQLSEANIHESNANFRQSSELTSHENTDQAKLDEEARQFDALRGDKNAENRTPDKVFERLVKTNEGLAALRVDHTDEEIDVMLAKSGANFRAGEFAEKFAAFSDEKKAQLQEQNQYLKSLEMRVERDGPSPSLSDKITKVKARIANLQKQDDELQDSKFRQDELAGDRTLAQSLGRGFARVIGGGVGMASQIAEIPEEIFMGAAKEGAGQIDKALGNEPRNYDMDWSDVADLLGLGKDEKAAAPGAKPKPKANF